MPFWAPVELRRQAGEDCGRNVAKLSTPSAAAVLLRRSPGSDVAEIWTRRDDFEIRKEYQCGGAEMIPSRGHETGNQPPIDRPKHECTRIQKIGRSSIDVQHHHPAGRGFARHGVVSSIKRLGATEQSRATRGQQKLQLSDYG